MTAAIPDQRPSLRFRSTAQDKLRRRFWPLLSSHRSPAGPAFPAVSTADALKEALAVDAHRRAPTGAVGLESATVEWGIIAARLLIAFGMLLLALIDADLGPVRVVAAGTLAVVIVYSAVLAGLLRQGHVKREVIASVALDTLTVVAGVLVSAALMGRDSGGAVTRVEAHHIEHGLFQPLLALLAVSALRLVPAVGLGFVVAVTGTTGLVTYFLIRDVYSGNRTTVQFLGAAFVGLAAVLVAYVIQKMRAELTNALADRTRLIAEVTQEIRNPLTTVRAAIDLAGDESASGVRQGATTLALASRGVRRLENLAQSLADLEYASLDGASTGAVPLDLARAAELAVAGARPFARERQITLKVDHGLSPAPALGEAAAVARVLDNLLSNAIKFSAAGDEVILRTFRNGQKIGVQVADSGPGIAGHEMPHLFERFFRGRHARQHRLEGIGLGLHISAALAERTGGEIRVWSREGKGSAFELLLPAEHVWPGHGDSPATGVPTGLSRQTPVVAASAGARFTTAERY